MTLKTYGYAYRSDTREAKSCYHINEDALITLPLVKLLLFLINGALLILNS